MFYFDCVTIQIFFLNLQKWLSDQERWDKGVTTHRFSEAIKAETLHIRPLSTFILAQLCGVFPPRLKLLDPHNYITPCNLPVQRDVYGEVSGVLIHAILTLEFTRKPLSSTVVSSKKSEDLWQI